MRRSDPPRLAVGLLRRFVPDNEPLVGDLLERFAMGQSRLEFWRQVLLAIVIRAWQPPDQERPLGLAENSPFIPGERHMRYRRQVNLTASPVPGVGGLGLVALGVLVALVRPQVWWIFLPAILGGVAVGVTMVMIRRRAVRSTGARSSRILLRESNNLSIHPQSPRSR